MICPKCSSENVQVHYETEKKGFSGGQGCCGWLIFGPIGLLCGLCGKDKVTSEEKYWVCNNCGAKFTDAEALSTSGGVSFISNNSTDNTSPKVFEENNGKFSSPIDIPTITYGSHIAAGHLINVNGKTFYDAWGIQVIDGDEKIKLSDKSSWLISDGSSVYRQNAEGLTGKRHIIKIDSNTYSSEQVASFDHMIDYIHMDESYFVFSNGDDSGKLYRMNKDGTNLVKLTEEKVGFVTVWGEWVYYIDYNDKKSIYKIKLDGSARTKIYGGKKCQNLVFDGNQLYFTTLEGLLKTNLFCIKEGNSFAEMIAEDIFEFIVTDIGVFTTSRIDDAKCAFFISYNTKKKELLLKAEEINAINIDGGYLYYGSSLVPEISKRLNLHNGDIEQL